MPSRFTRRTVSLLTLTTACALLCTSCRSTSSKQTESGNNTGYGARMARQDQRVDEAIKEGTIDTWIAAPVYLDDQTPILSIYRGPKPATPEFKGASMPSNLNTSSFSKISWQRGYGYQDALLNMMRIKPEGEELIFAQTPHAFAEFLFIQPPGKRPASPSAQEPTQRLARESVTLVEEHGEAGSDHRLDIVLHQPQPTQQTPAKLTGPQLLPGPATSQNVANYFSTWEVEALTTRLALGCAVLRTEVSREGDEITWRYHGELWIRDLASDRVFKHGSAELEPHSWQLSPNKDNAQLEVVMADANGWPTRVDFIDLNTFEVRSMPTRQKLKEMGVK